MNDIASEGKSHTIIFPLPMDFIGTLADVRNQQLTKKSTT